MVSWSLHDRTRPLTFLFSFPTCERQKISTPNKQGACCGSHHGIYRKEPPALAFIICTPGKRRVREEGQGYAVVLAPWLHLGDVYKVSFISSPLSDMSDEYIPSGRSWKVLLLGHYRSL